MSYYAENSKELRRELGYAVPTETLKQLHRKKPVLHFLVTAALVSVLIGSIAAIVLLEQWYQWFPFAVIAGFCIFNFTVLLHEVVHRAVLQESRGWAYRLLGIAYAVPSGISASQFSRWHLDHHAGLGSDVEDPKRHYLSPRRNERWFKLLYFTPVLFPIYFRAARNEAKSYPPELQRTIAIERNATIAFHLLLLALVVFTAGWAIAWKAYLVPYFFIFPVAFALNRLGQHYDIDPVDPAKWSTLVKSSRFWNVVYLCSNFHLEHHYFPGVPLYNLPRLQKVLAPYYEEHGFVARTYGELFWNYIIRNKRPHSNWGETAIAASGVTAAGQAEV